MLDGWLLGFVIVMPILCFKHLRAPHALSFPSTYQAFFNHLRFVIQYVNLLPSVNLLSLNYKVLQDTGSVKHRQSQERKLGPAADKRF